MPSVSIQDQLDQVLYNTESTMQDAAHKVERSVNDGIFFWKYKWFFIIGTLITIFPAAIFHTPTASQIFYISFAVIRKLVIRPILLIKRLLCSCNRLDPLSAVKHFL